jgi:hypothetical protein
MIAMRSKESTCDENRHELAEAYRGHEGFDCSIPPDTTGTSLFLQIGRDSEDQNLGSNCGYRGFEYALKAAFNFSENATEILE